MRPQAQDKPKIQLPSIEAIKAKPALQLVKKYCDALGKMSGKPTTLETLKIQSPIFCKFYQAKRSM